MREFPIAREDMLVERDLLKSLVKKSAVDVAV